MRQRGESAANSSAADCDFCMQRKGRNHQIVHMLKFTSEDELRRHLAGQFDGDNVKMEPHLKFYNFAHRYYGQTAKEKFIPLWMVYLEAHGVKVNNRGDVIMRYRGHVQEEFLAEK